MKAEIRPKEEKGITLIALVITIIVLLILAGVAIATLTGENGILTQASKAKDKSTEAETIERVQVEVAGSYGTDGKIDLDQLNKNLRNIKGLTYNKNDLSDTNKINNLPATVTLNGYDIVIEGSGKTRKPNEIEKAKANGTVFVDDKTTITDAYGNSVTIPKGFKIASDSATDVTGGIVIEDATYANTIGSQFVWIPVGDIYTDEQRTEANKKTITLGRYNFTKNSDGTITTSEYSGSYTEDTEESHNSSYGNAIAKDVEKFKESTSVDKNGGYYIGRYEAGVTGYDSKSITTSNSNSETNWTGYTNASGKELQLVCKSGQQVWNYVTQNKASELSKNMYDNTVPFTSDLINSYAWDTAIVFEQAFDDRSDKTTPYSIQTSFNGELEEKGTTTDKICNIYDMASNCFEWTTETGSDSYAPYVSRGGYYSITKHFASGRQSVSNTTGYDLSFRPVLYV